MDLNRNKTILILYYFYFVNAQITKKSKSAFYFE